MTEQQIEVAREKARIRMALKRSDSEFCERNKARSKQWYQEHREIVKDRVRKWCEAHKHDPEYKEMHSVASRKWRESNKKESLEVYRRHNRKVRLTVLQMISKVDEPVCVGCGCKDIRLLEINHKDGHGSKEYHNIKREGPNLFHIQQYHLAHAILKGKRKVDDLEVLCKVCNAKHHVERKFGLRYKVEFLGVNLD